MSHEYIKGKYVLILDSDDMLTMDAVETVLDTWEKYNGASEVNVIYFYKKNTNGETLCHVKNENKIICTYRERRMSKLKSRDCCDTFRTDAFVKFNFPVFEGEKYVPTAYKYRLIDQEYKLAVLDDVLCNVEYQADGSTATMWKQYLKNPRGFVFWRKVCMIYPESKKRLIIDTIHYCAECQLAGEKYYIRKSPRKLLTLLCVVPGTFLNFMCRKKDQ